MDPNQFNDLMKSLPQPKEQVDPSLMGAMQAGADGAHQASQTQAVQDSQEPIRDFFSRLGDEIAGADSKDRSPGPAPTNPDGSEMSTGQRLGTIYKDAATDAIEPAAAAAGGALKSVFETKDFLFGDTPRPQQSELRRGIEEDVDRLSQKSLFNGIAASMGQFTAGMIGVGKLGAAAKALPWVGKGIAAVAEGAPLLTETAKAATVGALVFDPQDARLSNLIQDTPLANPVTAWLAASPDDSDAMGRVKSAMESIGLDATLTASFLVAGKIMKHLKAGDTAAAQAEANRFQAQQRAEMAKEQAANASAANEPAQAGGPGTTADVQPTPGGNAPEAPAPVPGNAEAPNGAAGPSGDTSGAAPAGDGAPVSSTPDAGNPMGLGADANGVPTPGQAEGAPGGPKYQAANENVGGATEANPPRPAPEVNVDIPDTGARKGGPVKPMVNFADEDTQAVLKLAQKDADAMWLHDGYYGAMLAGHKFGDGDHLPYGKLNTDQDLENFMTRVTDAAQERADKLGGGAILHDAQVQQIVRQTVALYGKDPQAVLNILQNAGRNASREVAKMTSAYTIMQKAMADASLLAEKFRMEDHAVFGGDPKAHMAEIKKQLSVAASLYAAGDSMSSNAGRSLRGMRRDVLPWDWSKVKSFTADLNGAPDAVVIDLLGAAQGRAQALKTLMTPKVLSSIGDFLQYMRINNLVSGPLTQVVNVVTSGAVVGMTPMTKILGALPGALIGNKKAMGAIGMYARQYNYMGATLIDGFKTAGKAFLKGDSVLSPHNTEMWHGVQVDKRIPAPGSQPVGKGFFKPWNSTGNIVYNALSVAGAPIGVPTRALGSADELLKQITYRSKVMARAHTEALEQIATRTGMTAADKKAYVKQYVKDKVDNAFDAQGRGLDPNALKEANIATFQQDLLPGTFGRHILAMTQQFWPARFVIPFVKTPTNVIRTGWKLTPGLNILQGEYRDMLLGHNGIEAQHQAVGQMAMGSLFLGAAAYLSSQGLLTGGGPLDPKARAETMATGWKPYSIPRKNEDGTTTYYSLSKLDPVAIPMGIVADIMDHMHNVEWDGTDEGLEPAAEAALLGLVMSVGKQFQQKTYLLGATQMLDAIMNTNEEQGGKQWETYLSSQAQSLVPFSGLTRQTNDDIYLRDARSLADKLMQVTPGLSDKLDARRNWMGEKMVQRPGLWSTDEASLIDQEMTRLTLQNGTSLTRASPYHQGVDLRDLTMEDGKNAYERFQELTYQVAPGKPTLRARVYKLMTSKGYMNAPDGAADINNTKMNQIADLVSKARKQALQVMQKDKQFRQALMLPQQQANDQFRAVRGLPPKAPTPHKGIDALERMGEAFGIDLDGQPDQPQE
jgi:hypothetical protein